MKRLLICLFVLFAFWGKAQLQLNVTAGPRFKKEGFINYSKPTGVGFEINPVIRLGKWASLGLSTGYSHFGFENEYTRLLVVPLDFGFRVYYPEHKLKPFIGFSVGTLFASYLYEASAQWRKHTQNYFTIAPILGVEYEINPKFGLTANARLNYVKDGGFFYALTTANIGVYFLMKPKSQEAK